MVSQRIVFEKLLNTRDLGGMPAAGGRKIRPGKLIRSGHLFGIPETDVRRLADLIDTAVDFRSVQECSEKPEPAIPGVSLCHIPIFEARKAGVTRDKASFEEVRQRMMFETGIARDYMCQSYESFADSEYSRSQYERFIRLLLENHSKAVLWHCTAGKDRAGFAAVIVQELLGVSKSDIIEDYLLTNECLEPEIRDLTAMICGQPGIDIKIAEKSVQYIFTAKTEYLTAVYGKIEELYGSFDGYIQNGLHITPAERKLLQEMYLE